MNRRWRFRLVLWALGGAWVLLFVSHAKASTINGFGGASVQYVTGGAVISDGSGVTFQGRTWETPAAGSRGVVVAEQLGMKLGGNALSFGARRLVPPVAAAMALRDAWNIGQAIGGEINRWLNNNPGSIGDARCQISSNGWQCDAGTGTVPTGNPTTHYAAYCDTGSFPNCENNQMVWPTAEQACDAVRDMWNRPHPEYGPGTYELSNGNHICTVFDKFHNKLAQVGLGELVFADEQCPAVIDALDPQYSRPAGGAKGLDGKCPSGRYQFRTDQQVVDAVGPSGDPRLLSALPKALEQGATITVPDERNLSGPSSLTGQPSTTRTVAADGTVTTTTSTPTTSYAYGGNKIQYTTNNSTVIQTCVSAGSCTTTTTTTTSPPPAPIDTPETPTQDDPCKANPGRVGCVELGTPDDSAPKWDSKTVSYQADDLGLGSGSCPEPYQYSVPFLGQDHPQSMDYSFLCSTAPTIRPAVLAIAAFAAIGICIGAVTKQS